MRNGTDVRLDFRADVAVLTAKGSAVQEATIRGDSNILVQAAGNGIDIRIGPEGNRLELARRHLRNVKVAKELDLLNPFTRAIDLVGRDSFLADLEAWLLGPAPVAVRCLTGRGGSGKTRLALELCARAEAGIGGCLWHAGFATSTEQPIPSSQRPGQPGRLGLAA